MGRDQVCTLRELRAWAGPGRIVDLTRLGDWAKKKLSPEVRDSAEALRQVVVELRSVEEGPGSPVLSGDLLDVAVREAGLRQRVDPRRTDIDRQRTASHDASRSGSDASRKTRKPRKPAKGNEVEDPKGGSD